MYAAGIGQFHTIDAFVKDKIRRFQASDKTFASVFSFITGEPDNIFMESNDGYHITAMTYADFKKNAYAFASALRNILAPYSSGSPVGIFMDNSAEWLELFWAILLCGYRPLLLNKRLSDLLLNTVLSEAEPCLILSDGKRFSVDTLLLDDFLKTARDLPDDAASDFQPSWADEIILVSSGTSSHIKLSYYSGENIFWQICDSAHIIRQSRLMRAHYKGKLKLLTFLPFYHIFGLVAVFMWFAFFSRAFVLLKDFSADTVLNTIKLHEVTHIFAVPLFWDTVYRAANKKIAARGEKTVQKLEKGFAISDKLSRFPLLYKFFGSLAYWEVRAGLFGKSIRFMISGGAAIPSETLRFFNHIGYHLANGYGMTEVGITSVELSNRADILISGSVGLPFYSLEYRLDDRSELLIRGKTLANAISIDGVRVERRPEDWFFTQDRAVCKDGRYYILGRADDLLIGPNGENIDPDSAENEMRIAHSPEKCLVRGSAPQQPGTLIISVSRLMQESTLSEIRSSAAEELTRLGLNGSVGEIYLTYDPLMGANDFKINRGKICRLYAEGKLSDANTPMDGPTRFSALTDRVREVFADVLEKDMDTIGESAHFFFDLGGSSLDYLAALMRLQNEFQIGFPSNDGNGLSTAKDIAAYIDAHAGEAL